MDRLGYLNDWWVAYLNTKETNVIHDYSGQINEMSKSLGKYI